MQSGWFWLSAVAGQLAYWVAHCGAIAGN